MMMMMITPTDAKSQTERYGPDVAEEKEPNPIDSLHPGGSLRTSTPQKTAPTLLTFDTELEELPAHPTIERPNLQKYASPLLWSTSRKNVCMVISCAATLLAAYSAGAYSIAASALETRFGVSSFAVQTGVTAWCVGFATSPMCLAPLSEMHGRRPVFLFSGTLFLVSLIGCAVTESFAGMLVARFFVGAGASTFATMVGGVVSDIYHAKERNTPMAIYSASALTGTGLGPLCSGFVVSRTSWRWVFWHQAIALGAIMVLMAVFFNETRDTVLLHRKTRDLNLYLDALQKDCAQSPSGNPSRTNTFNLNTRYSVSTGGPPRSFLRLLYLSVTIPFKLLFTEPIVFSFSLWAAFAWAVLYLQLNVLPLVFSTRYSFDIEQQGAVFASIGTGTLVALILSIYQERVVNRFFPSFNLAIERPEGRLYFACLEAALLPVGLFWFGWTAETDIHWIVPCLGICCAMMGIFSIYLAVFNYLADVYPRCASSALACQSFCRNILAAVFPLFSQAMFRTLGYGGASSLLGGLASMLTIVPWVLVFKGEEIRARSKVAAGSDSVGG